MNAVSLALIAGALSLILTALVRRYAQQRNILDYPNQRSSHTVPTPRGGGLAIALVTLTAIAWLGISGRIEPRLAIALVGGGLVVALIGWLDDRKALPASIRFTVQLAAAAWAVWYQGGLTTVQIGASAADLGLIGSAVAILGIVWLTNLYNFMDGIDGLAAGQAVLAAAGGGWLLSRFGDAGLATVAFVVAGAAAGFLVWNWAPARIFMGDVGSGLLGFLFGCIAVASEKQGGVPALALLLLLGTFIFDATVTLIRRVWRREAWYSAHRSHAYQRVVQAGWSHQRVTAMLLGVGILLGVFAWLAASRPSWLGPIVLISIILLSVLYYAIERIRPMAA